MRRLLLLVLPLLFVACSGDKAQFAGSCEKNEQCGVGAFCKKSKGQTSGLCACRSDEACKEGEICNTEGLCQKRSDCRSNAECDATKFCDLATGNCIDRTNCGTDIHCLPGSVCNKGMRHCESGCFDDADCPLYSVCDRSGLTSTTALGRCLMGKCGDRTFCAYGDKCVNGTCMQEVNPNFCRDCDPQTDDCGDPNNFCLINSSYDGSPAHGGANFCGIACVPPPPGSMLEDPCPNGYQCGSVILLTQDQCTSDMQCGGGGRQCYIGEGDIRGFCTCAGDADCGTDMAPPICRKSCGGLGLLGCNVNSDCPSGNCAGTQCISPENRMCSQDAQCQPSEICTPLGGQKVCLTTGLPCNTNDECLCNSDGLCINSGKPCTSASECRLSCVNGGCLLGASCAPIQGLLCPDLRR